MSRRWIGSVACVTLAVTSGLAGCSSDAPATTGAGSGGFHAKGLDSIPVAVDVKGKPLPEALRKFAGKPLVVNFFSSTCVACKTELPALASAHKALGDTVTFIGVATVDLPDEARKVAATAGVTYDIIDDPSGDLLAAFGGATLPATAFISPDGTIRSVQLRALDTGRITSLIKEQLGT